MSSQGAMSEDWEGWSGEGRPGKMHLRAGHSCGHCAWSYCDSLRVPWKAPLDCQERQKSGAVTHWLQLFRDPGLPHRMQIFQTYACIGASQASMTSQCQGSEESEGTKQENWVHLRQGTGWVYLPEVDCGNFGVKGLRGSSRKTCYKYHLNNLLNSRWKFGEQYRGFKSRKHLACGG